MPDMIQSIFITPGIAFARLGSSTTPLHAYEWVRSEAPRMDGETTIVPAWTLAVQPDASVAPFKPDSIAFRDGSAIRPLAPFFEIWARLGAAGTPASEWRDVPLTPALLAEHGMMPASLRLQVIAQNLKAARRAADRNLGFGTHPAVTIAGNDHRRVPLLGVSPPSAATPMIPAGANPRSIPLGSVQILRSIPQPPNEPWSNEVNVEVIRFRFTPAAGLFYGPPDAVQTAPAAGRPAPAVRPENAFLDPDAGWRGASTVIFVQPGDTYDVFDQSTEEGRTGPSLGVVDDTCEAQFEVSLQLPAGGARLVARAAAFVGPPDFGPDRRPFVSVADEFNDRSGDAGQRNAAVAGAELDRWVEDLFERIYETVSLYNVDRYRNNRASTLPASKLQARDIDGGVRLDPDPTNALGGRDALRNQLFAIAGISTNDPLPFSEHARMRHRALSDLQNLIELVALDPERLASLIRKPFEVEAFENANATSMRMPAFMRQSNGLPLTLAVWQYELLMRWAEETVVRAPAVIAVAEAAQPKPRRMSRAALARRAAVLSRLAADEGER